MSSFMDGYTRDVMDTSDIPGAAPKVWVDKNKSEREVMKIPNDRKCRPKFVIARNYADNDTFDYSDVNVSQ